MRWSRLQSDKGICFLGVVYACYILMMSSLFQNGDRNAMILSQILVYLPCLVIALLFFQAQVMPLLKKAAWPIVLFLLIVFAMVAVHHWLGGARVWSILQLILLVGPMEELFYRGVVYLGFRQRHPKRFAWIASSLLFIIAHLGQWIFMDGLSGANLLQQSLGFLIFALLFSAIMIFLMEQTSSLWVPMVFHALWDLSIGAALISLLVIILYLYLQRRFHH